MATLADELQNDFADSGSENEAPQDQDGNESEDDELNGMRIDGDQNGDVQKDGDEDENAAHPEGLPGEAPEETEARLKAQKRDTEQPADMRRVAKFTASMEPVLEVSHFSSPSYIPNTDHAFTS